MKAVVTEKAVMMIESMNIITFQVEMGMTKTQAKKEIEEIFKVKIDSIKSLNRNNKKYLYVKLKKNFPAIDVATKLGLM